VLARYSTVVGDNGLVWARNAQPAAPPFLLVGMRHGMSAQYFKETGWLVREVVHTRVSEAALTAFAHHDWQNFVIHRDNAPTVRMPIAAGMSRDGFMINGLNEKYE